MKKKAKYLRRIIFADKRKLLIYMLTITIMLITTAASYITTDKFIQSSAKKIGELSVINASETMNGVFITGENVINMVSDSIRSSSTFEKNPYYIQTYLQLVYLDLAKNSNNIISCVYCYDDDQLYFAGDNNQMFDIRTNQAYNVTGTTVGEIYYIPPHKDDTQDRQVITIAKKFGTQNTDMIAVDIRVDKLQSYLNQYENEKIGSGDLTSNNFEILVRGKNQKASLDNSIMSKISSGESYSLNSGIKMYTIHEKRTSYVVFTKKVGRDWYVSYKVAASLLYHSQYRILYQIILMAFFWMLLSIIIGFVVYRKELIRIVDPVTGLLNKIGVSQTLEYYLKSDLKKNLAIVYLDLDNFKSVNDTYGHSAGDEMIKHAGNLLYQLKHSFFGRIGGDEYAGVVYADKTQNEIIANLEVFLKDVAKPVMVNGQKIQISCSIGIVFYSDYQSLDSYALLNQADENMYIAKKTGKNKIFWT